MLILHQEGGEKNHGNICQPKIRPERIRKGKGKTSREKEKTYIY